MERINYKIIGVICLSPHDFIDSMKRKLKDRKILEFDRVNKELFDPEKNELYVPIEVDHQIRGRIFHEIITSELYYENRIMHDLLRNAKNRIREYKPKV